VTETVTSLQMFSLYVHLNSGCIQSNRLARAFEFDVRYTKGEEKLCVLDRNPCLAKMVVSQKSAYAGQILKR